MAISKNTHLPEISGGVVTVPTAGTLVVDTLLRKLHCFSATLATDSVATAASVSYELLPQSAGETQKVTVKTWAADGATAGSTAADVNVQAIGE